MERQTVRGRKKGYITSVTVGDDIISQLPKDLLELILERVPIRDAVRTSILSKNWRYNWTSIKVLTFDKCFIMDIFDVTSDKTHAHVIHHILLQHRGSINSIHLHVRDQQYAIWKTPMIVDMYNRSLQIVASKGVKDCTITHGDSDDDDFDSTVNALEDFPELFSCSQITKLFLRNFLVSIPPAFTGFPNLVSLGFWCPYFYDESLQFLINSCPKLEHLKLGCFRRPPIEEEEEDEDEDDDPLIVMVHASNLKHLKVVPNGNNCFHIDMKKLETLSITPFYSDVPCPIRPLAVLDRLERLKIELSWSSHREMVVCLFRSAPNLLELKMKLWCLYGEPMEEIAEFWEASNNQVILRKLKLLKIRLWRSDERELFLLKVLLARTPALEKIDVSNGQGSLSKVVQYPRASKGAKLFFEGVATDW